MVLQSPTASEYDDIAVVKQLNLMGVVSRCLHAAAEFGLGDAIGDEPVSVDEIAAHAGIDPAATRRVLRLLVANGVFTSDDGRFAHNGASRLLRSDHPYSLRPYVRNGATSLSVQLDGELLNAVRAGRPTVGFAQLEAHFAEHPQDAAFFDAAMVSNASTIIPAVLDAVDLAGCGVVADIGGGRGHVVSAIVERHPDLRGILFDLPHVIAAASSLTSDRLELVSGDFFTDALPAADGYLLMSVLHDWSDEDAARLLTNLRAAAPDGARLLVVETVLSNEPGPDYAKTVDVLMLAVTGGRERTASEYEQLLGSAGFELRTVTPTPAAYSIVEAVAV